MSMALIELTAGLESPLGGPAVDVNVGLCPGDDVPSLSLAAAGGQRVHLAWGQPPVPHVEVCQLPHEGLRGVKPSAQRVLWGEGWPSEPRGAGHVPAPLAGILTCSWPSTSTPCGLMGWYGARFSPLPVCVPSWYASQTPSRVVQVMQMWCHLPSLMMKGSLAT